MKISLGKLTGQDFEVETSQGRILVKIKRNLNLNYRETYTFRESIKIGLPLQGALLFTSHSELTNKQGILFPNPLLIHYSPGIQEVKIAVTNISRESLLLLPETKLAMGIFLQVENPEIEYISGNAQPLEPDSSNSLRKKDRISSTVLKG